MAQTYTVKSGDNLSTIAARYGVSISQITGYRSGNPNLIYPGEVLTIGSATPTPTPSPTPAPTPQPGTPVGNPSTQTYVYNQTSYAYGTGPYASQFPKVNNPSPTPTPQPTPTPTPTPQPQAEQPQTWYVMSGSGGLYFTVNGTQAQADAAARSKGLSGYQISTSPNSSSNNNGSSGTSTPASTDLSWLKNDANYKALPTDMQNYLVQYYGILQLNDQASQKKLLDALNTAQSQADPYWAEVLNVAKDSLTRTLAGDEGDFATQEKTLTDSIARIQSDLATKQGDLSIDQQAELARQATKYTNDLSALRTNAANTGLTFSSKRSLAEGQLATSNTDIVESTKRDYMRQARDLQTAADNGQADAIAKLADYKRILGETEMNAIRNTEAQIGTSNLPTISTTTGATPLGGINGTIVDQKTKDIFNRAAALASLGNPFG